jgi:effector-binding domain-containing protein
VTPEIEIVEVEPIVIAVVGARVGWANLANVLPKMIGEVSNFLKVGSVRQAGHNVAVYRSHGPDGAHIEAGVQVDRVFKSSGRIGCAQTPGGRAAHLRHVGPYHELAKAHETLTQFCDAQGFPPGPHWEIYAEWHDDPATLVTDVYRAIGA